MSISASDLDRKIIIQRFTSVPNEFNEPVETWTDFIICRAMRRDVSDGERFAAGQVGSTLRSRFVIRTSSKARTVTPTDRLVHEDAIWSIHGVKELAGEHRRFVEVTAVRDADG